MKSLEEGYITRRYLLSTREIQYGLLCNVKISEDQLSSSGYLEDDKTNLQSQVKFSNSKYKLKQYKKDWLKTTTLLLVLGRLLSGNNDKIRS
nr:12521_t:CDS:2 [Entrophospora candida]